MTIAHCIIARNEEACIRQAIESVASIVDELIVFDTGSTDSTIEIAKSLGAMVIVGLSVEAVGFAHCRNLCIKRAKSNYILALDPDEIILEDALARVKLLPSMFPDVEAFLFPRHNWFDLEMTQEWKDPWPDRHPHLFKNDPKIRYKNLVHEELVGYESRRICDEIEVHHFSRYYANLRKRANLKEELYLKLISAEQLKK